MFVCERCGNRDTRYLGVRNNKYYCRRCIEFIGREYEEISNENNCSNKHELQLKYPLTFEQNIISEKIIESYKQNKNTLVKAVCGAGKTEIVFGVIDYALNNNLKVGFAVPRKNVVIDLFPRFKNVFKQTKIISVYGGHNAQLEGDLIILTTHQLYRYNNYFDLLILDEVDAFPFYKNEVLYKILQNSVKGKVVILSATAPDEIIKEFKIKNETILELNVRYHHYPIPNPLVYTGNIIFQFLKLIELIKKYKKDNKQVFLFVPTIRIGEQLFKYLKYVFKDIIFVSSKTKDIEKIMIDFKDKKLTTLITTSILERGVTFDNLQVIVFNSDHFIFTKEALIQISGRVGRNINNPIGEVFFIARKETLEMKEAIYEISKSNKYL